MALQKLYEYGTKKGNYWRIIGNHPNTMSNHTVIRLALYANKEARDKDVAGYNKVLSLVIPGVNHTRESAYIELKKKAEFDGAIDA
jgi:hypothetical protein